MATGGAFREFENRVIITPRQKIYNLLNRGIDGYGPGRIFNSLMFLFITVIIVNVIIQTVQGLPATVYLFGRLLDSLAVIVFTTEYILRVWTCVENPEYHKKNAAETAIVGRLSYMVSGMAIIDLVALFWFYLPFFFADQEVYAMVGILKFFTIFKLIRYSPSLHVIARVFNAKRRQLAMMFYIILFLLVVTSAIMFYIEHHAQPEKFASIPDAMWWAVITLTTVGYGDVYPITPLGKFFGGLSALLGVGVIALPAGILASAFMEEVSKEAKEEEEHIEEFKNESDDTHGEKTGDDTENNSHGTKCTCPECGHEFFLPDENN